MAELAAEIEKTEEPTKPGYLHYDLLAHMGLENGRTSLKTSGTRCA